MSPQDDAASPGQPAEPSLTALPAEFETYYKAIVFIEGTAQLMRNISIEDLSSNPAGFAPLMMIPGVMDDKVIWAQKEPLPESLAGAWDKALEAEQDLIASLEQLLMMQFTQESYLQAIADSITLASEAVVEANAGLAAEGASAEELEALKRAALTEMGESYQTFASLLAAGESMGDDDSD